MANNKNNHQNRWQHIIILVLILVSSIGFIYSAINIVVWLIDNNTIKAEVNDLTEKVDIVEVEDSESTEIIEPTEAPGEFNPYYDYINMRLIDVDFSELKNINTDVSGWIQLGGTNINYPFVQGNDNEYYLQHSFYKKSNQAGWLFLDYRNSKNFSDRNNIIYGHALTAGSMFGTLKNILNPSWQNDTNNHVVKISTEEENTLWQIFSIYTIPNTSDYIQVKFDDDAAFQKFVETISKRSVYDFSASVSEKDKILTLSSCYMNSDNKIVLHAKLIKRQV